MPSSLKLKGDHLPPLFEETQLAHTYIFSSSASCSRATRSLDEMIHSPFNLEHHTILGLKVG